MKTTILGICVVAIIYLCAPSFVQAQDGPVDPRTGIAVAQMISPTNGSTPQPNPDGSITFTWCNANARFATGETSPHVPLVRKVRTALSAALEHFDQISDKNRSGWVSYASARLI